MAKRIFTSAGLTFTASAAGAQATSGGYMALKGQSAQLIDVLEILVSGKAAASAIGGFVYKRVSTLETGGITALAAPNSDGLMNPSGTALASTVTPFVAAVTNQSIPSNTVTDASLNLGMNSFGGILRWNAQTFQQWQIVGTAAPGIESVLFNSSTAGGASAAADAHIIYEPY